VQNCPGTTFATILAVTTFTAIFTAIFAINLIRASKFIVFFIRAVYGVSIDEAPLNTDPCLLHVLKVIVILPYRHL